MDSGYPGAYISRQSMQNGTPIKAFDHIAVARLREIARADAAAFKDEEFRHLQTCPTCFQLWKQFIEDLERDE